MTETTLGAWLRGERERRGVTLKTVADQTKVAAPLLEGLENGDLSRWPGGIYRRAFVKAYASALGLDADDVVRRFEREHPDAEAIAANAAALDATPASSDPARYPVAPVGHAASSGLALPPARARLIGTAADLTVALVLGLGSAAAGSRLLWPVLLIALYYSIGVLLKGTSPMVALLTEEPASAVRPKQAKSGAPSAPDEAQDAHDGQDTEDASRPSTPRPQVDRRHTARRSGTRPPRSARTTRPRVS